jgi:hypothetical protein
MKRFLLMLSLALMARGALAAPQATEITVRVQAHDAKFIGSGVGEMNVIVEDADTGAVLATGRVSGGTGDTDRLMTAPVARGASLSDDSTAAYTARLMLERPVRVRIRAVGPLAQPDAMQEASVTTWVVPGRPFVGDGIVLRLPGLIVTSEATLAASGRLLIASDVKLMCGCPITKDGLWDADDYEVHALVSLGDEAPSDVVLAFTGQTSRFLGESPVSKPGRYQVTVWAHNARTGNTGVASSTVQVP